MKILIALLISLFISPCNLASEQATFSFSVDNDSTFDIDKEYTNGLFASFSTQQLDHQQKLSWLTLAPQSLDKYEFVIGQKIYTPDDLGSSDPVANQRPYAGVLYGEINYLSILSHRVSRANFLFGALGEGSLASEAQRVVHEVVPSQFPNGWDYQVEEGLVANIGYLNHVAWFRTDQSQQLQFEISNISEVNLGNFRSDVSSGIMCRIGENLDSNLGAANIDSELPFRASALGRGTESWVFYIGAEARYRFNDATIEGDRPSISDSESYKVTLKNRQATAIAGITYYSTQFGANISATIGTTDYQESRDNYHANTSFSLFFFL